MSGDKSILGRPVELFDGPTTLVVRDYATIRLSPGTLVLTSARPFLVIVVPEEASDGEC
jgi:hypothetical protein